jgi:hypothetical protein
LVFVNVCCCSVVGNGGQSSASIASRNVPAGTVTELLNIVRIESTLPANANPLSSAFDGRTLAEKVSSFASLYKNHSETFDFM